MTFRPEPAKVHLEMAMTKPSLYAFSRPIRRMASADLRAAIIAGLLVHFALATPLQSQSPLPAPSQRTLESKILQRIRNQPVGSTTLESLNPPQAFLDRVADRIVRMEYQNRMRQVVDDTPQQQKGDAPSPAPGSPASQNGNGLSLPWTLVIFGGATVMILAIILLVKRGGSP